LDAAAWKLPPTSGPPATEQEAASAVVHQTKLKELLAKSLDTKKAKFVKNVPIAVYPLNAESFKSMPSLILEEMGGLDKATYPNKDAYLKANFGGAMALQVAHGKLDAYPIPAHQYESNYNAVSLEEMQTKNPKNATALSAILGDLSTIPGVCGALKTVPTEMILASDLGFLVEDLLKIEAPWGGDQTKDAGKEAWIVACDEPYLINLDESGLPVAYIMAADTEVKTLGSQNATKTVPQDLLDVVEKSVAEKEVDAIQKAAAQEERDALAKAAEDKEVAVQKVAGSQKTETDDGPEFSPTEDNGNGAKKQGKRNNKRNKKR
jgi:hypothetical protein